MLVKRERKMTELKTYSLSDEEINALNTTAEIIEKLHEEGYVLVGDRGVFDCLEAISLINTIIWENNEPHIAEWEVD